MIKCVRCDQPDGVQKAGFVRGRQRYFCKACGAHFTLAKPRPASVAARPHRAATITDVARQAGVAPSTVSRALNGQGDISAATRQAVLAVARQLNYQPNLLAQSLKHQATYTVGVVIPDIERPFFAAVVSAIQQVVSEAGYRVMICQSKESYQMEVSNVQALVASQVDGLLVCHARETENFDHMRPEACRDIPVVHFDRVDEALTSSRVMLDDWGGAFAVTEHLLREGCRHVAVLAGPRSLLLSRQRVAGYRSALRQYQLPFREELVTYGDFQTASTLTTLDQWLALPTPPDAIFAIRYTDAFTVMAELKRRGLHIPRDVAVAGFGDEFLATMIEPGLTTVDLHPQRIGQQAAELFLEQVGQPEQFIPRTCVIAGDLIIRQSSLKGRGELFQRPI